MHDANVPELDAHEENDVAAACNKEDLHESIVEGDIAPEEVEIAGSEDGDV